MRHCPLRARLIFVLVAIATLAAVAVFRFAHPREVRIARGEHSDMPIEGATTQELVEFAEGNVLFDAPAREVDGLGPLYVRTSCASCHDEGVRGPGGVQRIVAAALPFGGTVRALTAAGATRTVTAPEGGSVSARIGPSLLGAGWVEAVRDDAIERVAAEQSRRSDAIRGRVSRVDGAVGRFGMKARIATLEEFVADALQHDIGLTSPLRPLELPNPDGLTDDRRPGIDVTEEGLHLRTAYVRLLAIPPRHSNEEGDALFARVKCAACHVPAMKTRADYAVRAMAERDAFLYSDLLLHDMGDALSDGVREGVAGPRDWRTTPLVGLRFSRSFMHDGRADDVLGAIRAHGGEAAESVASFELLGQREREALLRFVGDL